jgi:TatD DNase family protein
MVGFASQREEIIFPAGDGPCYTPASMRLFDSHAHLNLPEFDEDREAAIDRARAAGVPFILNVGVDAQTARLARDLARAHEGLYAAAALHPNYVGKMGEAGFSEVASLLDTGGFAAVGETGLDYYRDHSPPGEQMEAFRRHIALADSHSLPVIVHCREAHADCLRILREEASRRDLRDRVVMHCFGGDADEARAYVDLGFWVSFAGVLTFPKAGSLREAAAAVPLERTLAETDCPYLAPQAHRGRRNEPAYVAHVVEALAKIHGVPAEEAARLTTANAGRVFGIEVDE